MKKDNKEEVKDETSPLKQNQKATDAPQPSGCEKFLNGLKTIGVCFKPVLKKLADIGARIAKQKIDEDPNIGADEKEVLKQVLDQGTGIVETGVEEFLKPDVTALGQGAQHSI